ncbi:CHAT domain-containing protein [Streptacidiphilus sp. PAMC 29251]
MTYTELLNVVRDRLSRAQTDPGQLLTQEAVTEARLLGESLPVDSLDGLLVLATFHWWRYQSLPNDEDQEALDASVHWYGRVFPYAPGNVPAVLWPTLATTLPPAGDDPESWNAEAARYLGIAWPDVHTAVFDRAVDLLRRASDASDGSLLVVCLSNLCTALQRRFQTQGARDDLDQAVGAGRRAVGLITPDDPRRATVLSNLSNALRMRHDLAGSCDDLNQAIDLGEAAVEAARDDPNHAAFVSNLATALQSRYGATGVVGDLQRAVELGEQAVEATPADHPSRPGRVTNLVNSLRLRYEREGERPDLDRAVELGAEAAAASVPGDPDRPTVLSSFGNALRARYERDGDLKDLHRAIGCGRSAVEAAPVGHPHRPGYLSGLSGACRSRAERTGDPKDVEEAVSTAEQAAEETQDDSPDQPVIMSQLSLALLLRFDHRNSTDDLDRGLRVGRRAIEVLPDSHPEQWRCLSNLSDAFRVRFERRGVADDLEQAINVGERASREVPEGHPRQPDCLVNLANALQTRYEHAGALADLERAITCLAGALRFIDPDSPARAICLSNLSGVTFTRFTRTNTTGDLDDAINYGRLSLVDMPANHADRATLLSNLSNATLARFRTTGADDDIDEAVALAEQAVDATLVERSNLGRVLSNLGSALQIRHGRHGRTDDLLRARTLASAAVEATPPDHPDRAARLGNLGAALQTAYEQDRQPEVLREALDSLRRGAEIDTAPTLQRARVGSAWARLAGQEGEWAEAARAWSSVLGFLPPLVDHELLRADRQHHLSVLSGLGPEVAAVYIRLGELDTAWTVLELGRGLLLGQGMETRSNDTNRLAAVRPDLAAEFHRLRAILNSEEPAAPSSNPLRRREAVADWKRLLTEIRGLDSMNRFGLGPSPAEMRSVLGAGTVVAPVITALGADALLLTSDGSAVVPLPGVTLTDTVAHANVFLAASQERATLSGNRDRLAVLRWLWDAIAEPVLKHLGHTAPPAADTPWPRLWWMPTGALTVLPLHAAGHRPAFGRPSRGSVLDRVVSSYTPTVRTLHHIEGRRTAAWKGPAAQEGWSGPVTASSEGQVLIAAVSTASGFPPLASALTEADLVSRWSGGTAPLAEEHASCAAVRRRLKTSTWAHFACHAATDPTDPSASFLALHDGRLTVRELMALEINGAELAYLSACTTAFGGTTLLDESVHIASALQLAGFNHVIGTLWPISDDMAPLIADRVYARLRAGDGVAVALHEAVRHMRARYPANPHLWASHVHHGS